MNNPPASPTVLITGASGGIGLELARVFARRGHSLVLVARNEARLRTAATELSATGAPRVQTVAADLGRSGAAAELARELTARELTVDVLVNNAGIGTYGLFVDADPAEQTQMIQLNMTALTELTQALLPDMVRRGHGRILNVGSLAGFQPGPLMAVYFASKAYVLSFSEAIREELRGTGVTVTVLCPGPVQTEFFARARMTDWPMLERGVLAASVVAERAVAGLFADEAIVIPGGLSQKLLPFLLRLSPRALTRRLVLRMQTRRPATEATASSR
jgi:short-subunit dehydrogenase